MDGTTFHALMAWTSITMGCLIHRHGIPYNIQPRHLIYSKEGVRINHAVFHTLPHPEASCRGMKCPAEDTKEVPTWREYPARVNYLSWCSIWIGSEKSLCGALSLIGKIHGPIKLAFLHGSLNAFTLSSLLKTHCGTFCFSPHNSGIFNVEVLHNYQGQRSYRKSPIKL